MTRFLLTSTYAAGNELTRGVGEKKISSGEVIYLF